MEGAADQTTEDGAECLLSYAHLFPSYNNESAVLCTVFGCSTVPPVVLFQQF